MLPDIKDEVIVLSIIAFKSFIATPISIGMLKSETFSIYLSLISNINLYLYPYFLLQEAELLTGIM